MDDCRTSEGIEVVARCLSHSKSGVELGLQPFALRSVAILSWLPHAPPVISAYSRTSVRLSELMFCSGECGIAEILIVAMWMLML